VHSLSNESWRPLPVLLSAEEVEWRKLSSSIVPLLFGESISIVSSDEVELLEEVSDIAFFKIKKYVSWLLKIMS